MHPWRSGHWLPGVLSDRQIRELLNDGYLRGVSNIDEAADYSSIDLTLSNEAYRMKSGSIKPCGRPDQPYEKFCNNKKVAEKLLENTDGTFHLKANECYVFKLKETLMATQNPPPVATSKSPTQQD